MTYRRGVLRRVFWRTFAPGGPVVLRPQVRQRAALLVNADTYVMRKLVLEFVHNYAQDYVLMTSEVKADVFELEHMTRKLLIRLETHVLAEKRVELAREVEFLFPASWWDQLKTRHFPPWALRRWPPDYSSHRKIVTFAEYATFPQMDPSLYPPSFGAPVTVQTSEVS